jgi:carnitine O-acetyltransferase
LAWLGLLSINGILIISRAQMRLSLRRPFSRTMSSLSAARSPDWKSAAPQSSAAQNSLPKLPVPDLDSTLSKLKDSLRPLAWNDREWSQALRSIDAFKNGPGKVLQQRLVARREEKARPHWLEEWWDDAAYLGYRDSVSTPLL